MHGLASMSKTLIIAINVKIPAYLVLENSNNRVYNIHHKNTFVLMSWTLGGGCMKEPIYFIVDSSVLPEVFSKVIETKALLRTGRAKTINEAVKLAGISRSAFYKYKEYVFPFYETNKMRLVSITLMLEHVPGVLSKVLDAIAEAQGSILTINQNIPINDVALVSISFETAKMQKDVEELLIEIKGTPGVKSLNIVSRE